MWGGGGTGRRYGWRGACTKRTRLSKCTKLMRGAGTGATPLMPCCAGTGEGGCHGIGEHAGNAPALAPFRVHASRIKEAGQGGINRHAKSKNSGTGGVAKSTKLAKGVLTPPFSPAEVEKLTKVVLPHSPIHANLLWLNS